MNYSDEEFQAKLVELVVNSKTAGEENYVLRQAARILMRRSAARAGSLYKENNPYTETINMSKDVRVTLTADFSWR